MNPDAKALTLISNIRKKAPKLRFNVSFEDVEFSAARPYYATARYLHAEKLMEAYQLPLLMSDVDGYLAKSPDGLASVPEIGIKRGDTHRLNIPWTDFLATTTWLPYNEPSLIFLKHARNYFWRVYRPDENYWFIDQSVLNYAARNVPAEWLLNLTETPYKRIFNTYSGTRSREEFIESLATMQFPDWATGPTPA
jgi:hypothetical protein